MKRFAPRVPHAPELHKPLFLRMFETASLKLGCQRVAFPKNTGQLYFALSQTVSTYSKSLPRNSSMPTWIKRRAVQRISKLTLSKPTRAGVSRDRLSVDLEESCDKFRLGLFEVYQRRGLVPAHSPAQLATQNSYRWYSVPPIDGRALLLTNISGMRGLSALSPASTSADLEAHSIVLTRPPGEVRSRKAAGRL